MAAQQQLDTLRIIVEFDGPTEICSLVQIHFGLQHGFVQTQRLVREVDQQLLEVVDPEGLEAENIEDADE